MIAFPATRYRIALAIAAAGVALSGVALGVHLRLAAQGPDYTSFCNLGGVVDCDAVLGSRYASLLGFPVAAWAMAAYGLGALLCLARLTRPRPPGALDLVLVGLAGWSLGFTIAMAGIAILKLERLCLICVGLYAVTLAWFAALAPLASRFAPSAGRAAPVPGWAAGLLPRWWERRPAAYGVLGIATLLAIGTGLATRRSPLPRWASADAIREEAPDFYRWYTSRRVVAGAAADGRHVRGAAAAPVTIVEFSDFQCSFCAEAYRDLRELMSRRGREAQLVFRHFPLDAACNREVRRPLHSEACQAAAAAECAGDQGRFWPYHDMLFEHQQALDRESLVGYARSLDLDLVRFRACLDSERTRAAIARDLAAGFRLGVRSTPTLFINGRAIEGAMAPVYYDYALTIERDLDRRPGTAAGRP